MTIFGISLATMLLFGFPFMVTLLGSLILYVYVYMPDFAPKLMMTMVQQVITGVTPPALVCVPMFILSASIITSGKSAGRLIRMIKTFVGHLPGGLPITDQRELHALRRSFRIDPGDRGRHRRHHAADAAGSRIQQLLYPGADHQFQ